MSSEKCSGICNLTDDCVRGSIQIPWIQNRCYRRRSSKAKTSQNFIEFGMGCSLLQLPFSESGIVWYHINLLIDSFFKVHVSDGIFGLFDNTGNLIFSGTEVDLAGVSGDKYVIVGLPTTTFNNGFLITGPFISGDTSTIFLRIRATTFPPQDIPGLFNTGENLVPTDEDANWTITSSSVTSQAIVIPDQSGWTPNDSTSSWLGFPISPPGQSSLETTFDLTGFDETSSSFSLEYQLEGTINEISLNSTIVPLSITGSNNSWTPISLNQGFLDSINNLRFSWTHLGPKPLLRQSIGLFNTGEVLIGDPSFGDAFDPNWNSNGVQPAIVNQAGGYPGIQPNNPRTFLLNTGYAETTFDLTGYDLSSISIGGNMFVDDRVISVFLNGVNQNISRTGFGQFNFQLSGGYVSGLNTLRINWSNQNNRQGLKVTFNNQVGTQQNASAIRVRFVDSSTFHCS